MLGPVSGLGLAGVVLLGGLDGWGCEAAAGVSDNVWFGKDAFFLPISGSGGVGRLFARGIPVFEVPSPGPSPVGRGMLYTVCSMGVICVA